MICTRCNINKNETEFYGKINRHGKFYLRKLCKNCYDKKRNKHKSDVLTDGYIRHELKKQGFTNITNELIELKKYHLILIRNIKKYETKNKKIYV